jgi:hypothetical protein
VMLGVVESRTHGGTYEAAQALRDGGERFTPKCAHTERWRVWYLGLKSMQRAPAMKCYPLGRSRWRDMFQFNAAR